MSSLFKFVIFLFFFHTTSALIKHTQSLPCPRCQDLIMQCHPFLQEWFTREQATDKTLHIMTAYRGPKDQKRALRTGSSKAEWGKSAHNYIPCFALDLFFLVDGKTKQDVSKYQSLIKRLPATIENGSSFTGLVDWSHFYVKDWQKLAPTYPHGTIIDELPLHTKFVKPHLE